LTVLFCDLVGSTLLSAELDPEAFGDLILAYQATCAKVAHSHGGYVAQYLGDGVLVYFGYPRTQEDDAQRAVRAGLELVAKAGSLTSRGRPLQVRIGIHAGPVVVSSVGTGPSSHQLAFGEAPNVAARVQAVGNPNEVLITEAIRRSVDGYFYVEPVGARDITSSGKVTALYRVLEPTGATSRLDAARRVGLSPFVGRGDEQAILFDHWEEVRRGESRTLLLQGDAGVGKSRLAEVLTGRTAADGARVLVAYASQLHQNSALHPIVSMVRRWLGADDESDTKETTTRLREELRRLDWIEPAAFSLMGALLGLPDDGGQGLAGLTPQRVRRLTIELLLEWIGRLSDRQPLVLLVEDLHWADPTTLETLQLIARKQLRRTLLCMTTRIEPAVQLATDIPLAELRLAPFSPAEAEEMVANVVGGNLPTNLAAQVYRRTDGIPLFIEEVTRALIESGPIGANSGPRPDLSNDVPATLHFSLMARLDRLGSAKHVAQLAAIFGREVSMPLLSRVAGVDPQLLARDVEKLIVSGLMFRLNAPRETFSFKHALVRDAAYGSLLRPQREEYHRRAAQAYLESDTAGQQPDIVATHLEGSGNKPEAARYWQLAGMQALSNAAYREAIAHLERALRQTESQPPSMERDHTELGLHLCIAPALMAINGWAAPQVETSCRAALELSDQLGKSDSMLPALWGLWSVYFVRGHLDRALPVAQKLMAIADVTGIPALKVMAHHALGFTLYFCGDFAEATRNAEAGIGVLTLEQEREMIAQIQVSSTVVNGSYLALCHWLRGDAAAAERSIDAATALARELGHSPTLAIHLSLRCELHFWQVDLVRLHETADQLIALSEKEGFALWLSSGQAYRGFARAMKGDLTQGLDDLEAGNRAYVAAGAGVSLVHEASKRAEVLARAGRIEEAFAILHEGERRSGEFGEHNADAEFWRVRGEIFELTGKVTEATHAYAQAVHIAEQQGAKHLESKAARRLAALRQRGAGPVKQSASPLN
jgi:class 3 adenylate cyclase/tetratricopeptide (TPR) repeat protein